MVRRTLVTALVGLGLLAAAIGPAMPALTDSNPPVEATRLLTWSPPALINPITVTLCNCNLFNGQILVNLKLGQDYILYDPVVLTYPVVIQGGHNIVWIGGEVRPGSGPDIGIQLIRNVGYGGGTVHLEGILLDGVNGVLTDGIEGGEWATLSMPTGTLADASLQIENVRIDNLSGDSAVTHQDCIQHYGGWNAIRVDHFTCQTLYQGFYLPWEDPSVRNQGVLSGWDIRNANLTDSPNSTGPGMQTLLHFGDVGAGAFDAIGHQQTGDLANVYLKASQRSFNSETYPNAGTTSADGTLVHSTINANGTIGWADTWAITGSVSPGDPPAGDFVPVGVAGLNYVSPGYQ